MLSGLMRAVIQCCALLDACMSDDVFDVLSTSTRRRMPSSGVPVTVTVQGTMARNPASDVYQFLTKSARHTTV